MFQRLKYYCIILHLSCIYVLLFHHNLSAAQGIGCIFLRDDQSIRCQNTTLQEIGESLHILTMVVKNKPQIVDIDYSAGGDKELPPIFDNVNASIDTLRVRRSGIQSVHAETFVPLATTLRDLDLSHNLLNAIPESLAVLWSLEHLNLQHNRIVFVRPGSIFDGLPSLREINLSYNYIGLVDERIDNITEKYHYQLKGNLGLEVFSLGKAIRSLESLNLRGNRLAAVPVQVSNYSFPELRHLDMSENVIGHLTETLSSALLPKMEFLDLHANRIQSIRFYSLPISLRYFDLTENPFHCDCSALWLYDWYFTNTTSIRVPICNSPESQRGIELNYVQWSTNCPEDNEKFSFRYMTHKQKGEYDLLQLVSSATAINISWKVRIDGGNKKWRVVYRRENDSPYQMTLSSPSQRSGKASEVYEAVLSDRIQNLQASTTYVVCIAVIQDEKYTIEQSRCQKVQTKSHEETGEGQSSEEKNSIPLTSITNVKTELDDISVSVESVTLKWKLVTIIPFPDSEVRHEWTLRIRRTGSDNYTDIPVFDITKGSDSDEQLYEYAIMDLASRTHYDVCLLDVDHRLLSDVSLSSRNVNESAICRTVVTAGYYDFYAAEITAISMACGICLIVIVVTVYLCRQKRLLKWKPKALTEWLCGLWKGERPQPIGRSGSSNKYPVASIPRAKIDNRWEQTGRASVGAWSTLRMPYKEFPQVDTTDNGNSPTRSYRDALSTVIIYGSGHSEC